MALDSSLFRRLRYLAWIVLLPLCGCSLLPQVSSQPTFHNPFPQLSKVAVAPFFNLSHEPTVDGRKVAMAYFSELQQIPGFDVVPVDVVEAAMREHHIELRGPQEARKLAQILDVDAVLIGGVTDYSPYYPPRLAMKVEWYAANPAFHPVPPGYGLPWGTAEEDRIPAPLVFESEMALAREQMKTQTPPMEKMPIEMPRPQAGATEPGGSPGRTDASAPNPPQTQRDAHDVRRAEFTEASAAAGGAAPKEVAPPGFPPDWPDPRGFIPPPPTTRPPTAWPTDEPVIRHTKAYSGHDSDFTEALTSYYYFRSDARFGGWQGYLQRSDDFIRFCCHLHVTETLTARGGAGETRVVWRWPIVR